MNTENLPDLVHVELLLAAGKCLPPRDIPNLSKLLGLEKKPAEQAKPVPRTVRRAALQACLLHALRKRRQATAGTSLVATKIAEDWPVNLTNLQQDEDQALRIDLGRLVAIAKHPKAWLILREQTRDFDPTVRQEALVSLGWLGNEQALEELRKQRMSEHEMIRAAAVKGLAHWGADELRPSLGPQEKSPVVRQEVAHQLGQFHDDHAAEMLRICLTDINPQVQKEAIQQAERLPERLAVPLLLTALTESSSEPRRLALAELERRSGKSLPFPIFGSLDERQRESALLRQQWPQRLATTEAPQTPSARESERQAELRIAELRGELRAYLDLPPGDPRLEVARERLNPLTVSDVRWIEELVPQSSPEQNERLATDVLPKISPVYQALHDLRQADISVRRKGAERLYQEGSKVSLSRMATLRLQHLLTHEQDSMVWRFCMLAVAQDGSPEALQIAQLAVNSSWPDIRVLGCDYIAKHGTAEQALWIRGLFADKNTNVQAAAVRAAIHCRNPIVLADSPDGQPGLKRVLTTAGPEIRVQVACCLCLFGDDQGYQELMRLSQNGDWMVRLQVVRGMAASGQTRFVASLINLGWTERHPSVRLGILQALDALVPETQRPSGLASTTGVDQKLTLWAAWWEKTRQKAEPPRVPPAIVEAAP
ncbi:MAG: HEAT repeat domain-containing protein [Planctomycetales bacterium]